MNVIPEARRREMITRAEEYYGLAPGAGLAAPATRSYPPALVPRREARPDVGAALARARAAGRRNGKAKGEPI